MRGSMSKRLLVISNNPLSRIENNGKTVLNLLNNFNLENIDVAQIYNSDVTPTVNNVNYYRVTDKDVLQLKKGRTIEVNLDNQSKSLIGKSKKRSQLQRLIRDILWGSNFGVKKDLLNFIENFSPSTILFVAGDFNFYYDLVNTVKAIRKVNFITYITDDYITMYENDNITSQFRKKKIRKKLIETIKNSDDIIVISKKMKEYYDSIFNIESIVFHNAPSIKLVNKKLNKPNQKFTLTYAGSLHSDRNLEINRLIDLIELDEFLKENIQINVFTNDNNLKKSSILNLYKPVQEQELYNNYYKSDALLFIESTDENNITKTRFSFSTKIIEYLQVCKPIILIGSLESYSIEYLSEVSLRLDFSNEKEIIKQLSNLIKSKEIQIEYGKQTKKLLARDYIEGNFEKKIRNNLRKYF